MKIFYWAPWIGKIGTIKAVLNSAHILDHYSKNKIETKIINSVGEWDNLSGSARFLNLSKFKIYKFLPQGGFIKSRITYIIIFLFSFWPLQRLLKKEKPDYLVVQLITSLPLFLKLLFNIKTKLILRISGYPKMNFIRKLFWKLVSKKIHKITFPSKDLYLDFKRLKIFDEKKMSVLYDPIISYKEVIKSKKDIIISKNLIDKDYILCIGRLTKQKNFSFLIDNFSILRKKFRDLKLVIVGEGELRKDIENQINKLNLNSVVKLEGFQSNVYKYLKHSKVFILSSLWEEIGFVIVEAASCNINIISSDCKNGPREFLNDGKGGYLFKNNNTKDFLAKFEKFMNESDIDKFKKKILTKKETRKFTYLYHFKDFTKILFN
tara:strand:+ start:1252 stop:2385 length:1134 start_codon:yes stop_codon:yes gene_type:complete